MRKLLQWLSKFASTNPGGHGRRLPPRCQRARRARALVQVEELEPRTLLSPGLTPAQIRSTYQFDQLPNYETGAGQTIAIVETYYDPSAFNDLHQFDLNYGINDPVFSQKAFSGTMDDTSSAKTALDVEWAHAVAPGANILLVEAATASVQDLFAAVDWARQQADVSVVSMGFTCSEANVGYDSYLTTPAGHSGITFVAATGDAGYPYTGQVYYPATSPNVLAVGGTWFTIYGGEIGSDIYGFSTREREPAFQIGIQGGVNASGWREVPDVVYCADNPYSVYWTQPSTGVPQWVGLTGTSAAAAQWAGLIAIADQARALNLLPALDGPTQTLPLLYHLPSSDFHTLQNINISLGSPFANKIVAALAQPFSVANPTATLYQLDGTGTLWAYNAAGWHSIDTMISSIAVGSGPAWGNTLVGLDHHNSQLRAYNDRTFTILDTGVTSFACGSGLWSNWLVDLTSSGVLKVNNGSGWQTSDTGVSSFAFGSGPVWSNWLVDLNSSGVLKVTNGSGWQTSDTGVTSFAFGSGPWSNWLADLTSSGVLKVTNGSGWQTSDTGVTSFAFGSGLVWGPWLVDLNSRGVLKVTNGSGWQISDTGVTSFAFGSGQVQGGWLVDLNGSGVLKVNNGSGWQLGDNDYVTWFAFGSGPVLSNYLFERDNSGYLKASYGNGFDTRNSIRVTSFAFTSAPGWDDQLIALAPNGYLERFDAVGYASSWRPMDSGVTSFAFGGTGSLVDLHGDGTLEVYTVIRGGAFYPVDTGVTSFAFGSGPVWGNYLVDLNSSGVLKANNGHGWTTLDTGVTSFVFGRSTLNVLESSGNLWQFASSTSKSLLDQNVVAMVLANGGFTLFATKKDGTVDQFSA